MNYTWNTITRGDVYRDWVGWFPIMGLLDGILNKPGLFDNQPLKNYLFDIFLTHKVEKNFSAGATDMNNNGLHRFHALDLTSKDD